MWVVAGTHTVLWALLSRRTLKWVMANPHNQIFSLNGYLSGGVFSFPGVSVTKHHKLGSLEHQRLTVLQFWRLGIRDEGADWVGSFRGR